MGEAQPSAHASASNLPLGETLSIQVYLAIRDRIFRGEWLPGTRLTLRALALELGTSVQPVRDAISKLTVERILVLRPNHSVQLPGIDRPMLDEIFSLRNILEGEAARLAATAMSDSDLDELQAVIRATRRVYTLEVPIPLRVAAIQEVARVLAAGCRSNTIEEQIINLRTRTAPFYAAALSRNDLEDREFVAFTTRIQDEFIDALRRRDPVAAAEIRKVDLYTFQQHIYRLLFLDDL